MLEQATEPRPPLLTTRAQNAGIRFAVVAALTLVTGIVVPWLPFFGGVFLILAVALHVWAPALRPFVEPFVRVPVARAAERRARLLRVAGVGVLLVASGVLGASIRGRLDSRSEQREGRQEFDEKRLSELLERAQSHLTAGDVAEAEFVLLQAEAIDAADSGTKEEIDELLERVRRSGDREAILAIVIGLPKQEFEALESGASVPQALEFGDHALTLQAVGLARAQLDQARQARARH
jgi:hypothetical protein